MNNEFPAQRAGVPATIALVLDTSGLRCPLPLLKAKQALNKLGSGQCLHLIATDAGALRDIPLWCANAGHQLTQAPDVDGALHFFIIKA